jgi:hypothetical protein
MKIWVKENQRLISNDPPSNGENPPLRNNKMKEKLKKKNHISCKFLNYSASNKILNLNNIMKISLLALFIVVIYPLVKIYMTKHYPNYRITCSKALGCIARWSSDAYISAQSVSINGSFPNVAKNTEIYNASQVKIRGILELDTYVDCTKDSTDIN